jgi:hypothetical protein
MTTETKPASRLPDTNGDAIKLTTRIKSVELDVHKLEITVVGTSPLVVHAWSDKAKKIMLDKQKGVASSGKEHKNPVQDFKASLYRLPDDSGFGFPTVALKASAVTAANDVELKKTDMRRAFHIQGTLLRIDAPPISEPYTREDIEYAPDIVFEHQHGASMRSDMVRISMGTADIRFRAQFPEWSITFQVDYNRRVITADQLVNLFNVAGFGVGIGENRPERDGSWGRFEVATLK